MINKYFSNMDFLIDLVKKIFDVKASNKITFKMYNDLLDSDFSEDSYKKDKLLKRINQVIDKNPKLRFPTSLFLFFRESFECYIKYEDKFNDIKAQLEKGKDINRVCENLKDDMWPLYPFFQEALILFAVLLFPDNFSSAMSLNYVMESMVRENAFVDTEGDVVHIDFNTFFSRLEEFFDYTEELAKSLKSSDSSMSFHDVYEIKSTLDKKFSVFELGFIPNYPSLYQYGLMEYEKIEKILKDRSENVFVTELKSNYKYVSEKVTQLTFDIKVIKRLEDLSKVNDTVNELKEFAVNRYNEYVDYINSFSKEVPDEFNPLTEMVTEEKEGTIDYLYVLIDNQINTIEVKFEEKKRLREARDLSIKIKNFDEFLIGLKTELGDFNNITKKKIGNLTCKEEGELYLNRIKIQKESYFKHVRVFDYIALTQGLDTKTFKIYKRPDFVKINSTIRDIERFLNIVLESTLPEKEIKEESDFENEGRMVDIMGNQIRVALMNEDFSELSFDENNMHTFNVHDYSAYHNLVDYAIDVRKQPVFQDYGDISEYPYFKPFKYQVDNVRTMLGRFEGKGVFGDQVGLGKTLEALMTADVMFRCATIRNAVIVTTKQTIHQWRNECATKFRHEDGTPMFEVYPKHDSYSFKDLMKELKKDKDTKNQNALKVYLVSTEQIKSNDTIEYIKESGEYFGLKNAAYNKSPYVPTDIKVIDVDIESIISLKHLDILKKRLPKELSRVIKESLAENQNYKKLTSFNVYGFFTYEYDESKKVFYPTNDKLFNPKDPDSSSVKEEVELLKKYTKCLSQIEERKKHILRVIDEMSKDNVYADKRLIDLLIFDEVQDLLIDFNKKGNKEQVLQEYIANIQKKYCILISATPIRNDLSDIFNLLYMVDKNRLGETKELAEAKFYNAYCGGARSLAEMAASKEAHKKFMKLNGLINSMFTRKRLYDQEVLESIRRQTATPDELMQAKRNNRDDYGGAQFIKLVGVIRRAGELDNMSDSDRTEFIERFVKPLFPKYDIDNEILTHAFRSMAGYVNHAIRICMNRLSYQMRMSLDSFNVFEKFIENYKIVVKSEAEDNRDSMYETAVKTCNLLCAYINRGLLAFYRSHHDYPTVFLSDYIDWRRPRKQGEKLLYKNDSQKLEMLDMLLSINDEKFNKFEISENNLRALELGKGLVFERQPELRVLLYKSIRDAKNIFGHRRRVYMNLFPSEEVNYDLSDFIHFGYFPKGEKSKVMKEYVKKISEKDESQLSFEEKRLLDTYTLNGTLKRGEENADTFKELNFNWFTEFTSDNENWNSLYFIDKTMLAGTDFNAANILIIGSLDKPMSDYLDPLELEQLIGRISRMGQTEECIVITCLDTKRDFNQVYYDILTDEEGFDLYGVCQTEVDFVMPVIMAVSKRLFSKDNSYLSTELDKIQADESDFKAVYKNEYIEYNAKRFPDIIKYAHQNKDMIDVYYNGKVYNPIDAVKEMIRLYSKVLRNDIKE